VGAAVVGLVSSPSPSQLSLQAAFDNTAQAGGFRFDVTEILRYPSRITVRYAGVWRSPDRLRLGPLPHSRSGVGLTVIGSSMFLPNVNGNTTRYRLNPPMADPFGSSDGPTAFALPPLGDVPSATHVAQNGDTYSFVVPRTQLSQEWIAYAGGQAYISPGPVARDVHVSVVVRNGYIVTIGYPNGVHDGQRADGPALWRISDFGSAPSVRVPRVN
jgi:hypothetical protein